MSQTYFGVLTVVGELKDARAKGLGIPLKFAEMAVGDGDGVVPQPDRLRSSLVREVHRAPLNRLAVDPLNPNQVIAELVIPENVGGWYIRELGLIDDEGDLIAICNAPESYKPILSDGSGRTQIVRMVIIIASAETVELIIDPSIVLATRQAVIDMMTEYAAPKLHQHDAEDIVSGRFALERIPLLPITQTAGLQIALDAKASRIFVQKALAKRALLEGDSDQAFQVASPALESHAINLAYADKRYVQASAVSKTVGELFDWPFVHAPKTGLLCNGATVSSADYPELFAEAVPHLAGATISIGAPGVVTWPDHRLSVNSPVKWTTTGALPGLVAGTTYYVIAAGLGPDEFQLSATMGGAAIDTGGEQSGVHTAISALYGCADDLSSFTLPNIQPDHTTVQSAGNEGTTTLGEIMSHAHTYSAVVAVWGNTGLGSEGASSGTYGTSATGGAANLAAGLRVRIYIRFA